MSEWQVIGDGEDELPEQGSRRDRTTPCGLQFAMRAVAGPLNLLASLVAHEGVQGARASVPSLTAIRAAAQAPFPIPPHAALSPRYGITRSNLNGYSSNSGIFDGDTPSAARPALYSRGHPFRYRL